jgi:hypothetical protein
VLEDEEINRLQRAALLFDFFIRLLLTAVGRRPMEKEDCKTKERKAKGRIKILRP